ncbi:MAG: DNA recombination protein RmuC [Deltaproteobacteria bacterium]|nr:DNA recombination protein RmuC [Deltaproteobacteria bacterium]
MLMSRGLLSFLKAPSIASGGGVGTSPSYIEGQLLWILVGLGFLNAFLLGVLLWRTSAARRVAAERVLRQELRSGREESRQQGRQLREEVGAGLRGTGDSIVRTLAEMGQLQRSQGEGVARRIRELQQSNEKRLDEMRQTVDEKLQGTLEKRLGESFKLVSERLEAVQRGLGEMQSLATGVGDLKRVLTNVKARGTWAEVQLGAILEQVLTAEQYATNVQTKEGSQQRVEFAIRLPGPSGEGGPSVWLPIDSKFPQEDYLRLLEAAETADAEGVQRASVALARAVKVAAREIRDKYLNPPQTTDFALMFLPTEGLYAEVLRQSGLLEELQQTYRVVVAGPTTLTAVLSSLRMGFRTLALEERASEVWQVLAAVKTEFGKFGAVLDKVKKQLGTASRTLDETGVRTRAMERRLREVESLPSREAAAVLGLEEDPLSEQEMSLISGEPRQRPDD